MGEPGPPSSHGEVDFPRIHLGGADIVAHFSRQITDDAFCCGWIVSVDSVYDFDDADGSDDPRGVALPPRSLIVTVFGLYVREFGGWVSVSTLIQLLNAVGVDAQAVRSAVSRLKRRGILVSEKRATTAGYGLSGVARDILEIGDRRIFARPVSTDEDWVMVVFSVPETERSSRHALRTRLAGMGFGNVTSGVWIAPAHLADDCRTVLSGDGLDAYADVFVGAQLTSGDLSRRVAQWWDLEALGTSYTAFRAQFAPLLDRWDGTEPFDHEADAFADYVRVLTAWRRLPYRDPGLPPHLLPDEWPGQSANTLFFALRALLEKPAHAFVDRI